MIAKNLLKMLFQIRTDIEKLQGANAALVQIIISHGICTQEEFDKLSKVKIDEARDEDIARLARINDDDYIEGAY